MITVDLYSVNDNDEVVAEIAKNIKYPVLPNKNDNLVFNDTKFEIHRIIHNIRNTNSGISNKVVLLLKPYLKEKTKQLVTENKSVNKNDFYIL